VKNTYFLLRHGESEANARGLIVSSEKNGLDFFGLTTKGKEQSRKTMREWKHIFSKETIIIASDFLRARETAEIVQEELNAGGYSTSKLLRERFFGDLELSHHSNYGKVWELDRQDPAHKTWGIESVLELQKRVLKLMKQLEKTHKNTTILLVGHGDPFHVLDASYQGRSLKKHMEINLRNAEMRKLQIKSRSKNLK
jgi:broad specificity phosphatase PhoE